MRSFFTGLLSFAFLAPFAWAMGGKSLTAELSTLDVRCEESGTVFLYGNSGPIALHSRANGKNSLEARYCSRMVPRGYEEAFLPGVDMPAEDLLHELSVEQFVHTPQLEWQSVITLNKEAENLWQNLVRCNDSPESARAAYFNAGRAGNSQLLCKDGKLGVTVYSGLRELHGRIHDFLLSTSAYLLHSHSGEMRFHPLFMQVLEEIYVLNNIYPILDDQNKEHFDKRYLLSRQANYLLMERELSAGKKLLSSENYERERLREYAQDTDMALLAAKKSLNIITLLGLNTETQCGSWGLWPGISRSILGNAGFDKGLYREEERIIQRIERACGRIQYSESVYDANFVKANLYFVKMFRELGAAYLGSGR